MASKVDIANNALTLLGANPILSLTQTGSVAAAMCNRHLPFVRDEVLRAFPWKCARKRATLAQHADTPTWKWDYKYQLPANPNYCLKVNRMQEEDEYGRAWTVEGRFLLTDSTTCNIMYTQRLDDVNEWDSLLMDSIAARLASKVAYKVTGSKTMMEAMFNLYLKIKSEAFFVDSQEGTPTDFRQDRIMNSRRGG